MAIPLIYNVRSVRARWTSTIVAVLGIAGTVGVFIAMLSLAHGFKATLVSSGSADNAIIMRAGATSELTGGVALDNVKIIQDEPGIARGTEGPLVTPEVVIVAPIPLISTGTDANVQIRGVSKNVLEIRRQIKIVEGRMFTPGLAELIVGKNATKSYSGLTLGNTISLGTVRWNIVGIFDAGGTSFDSEVWSDAKLLGPAYGRGNNFYQSVTVHLTSPDALQQLRDAISKGGVMDNAGEQCNTCSKKKHTPIQTGILNTWEILRVQGNKDLEGPHRDGNSEDGSAHGQDKAFRKHLPYDADGVSTRMATVAGRLETVQRCGCSGPARAVSGRSA